MEKVTSYIDTCETTWRMEYAVYGHDDPGVKKVHKELNCENEKADSTDSSTLFFIRNQLSL